MQRAAPPAGVKEVPSHPSQKMSEYEINRGVCEGYKRKSDMGILYNKVENLVGYKRDSEINPTKVVDASCLRCRKRSESFPKFMPMFSSFHACLFIKTRREFVNLRRLLSDT